MQKYCRFEAFLFFHVQLNVLTGVATAATSNNMTKSIGTTGKGVCVVFDIGLLAQKEHAIQHSFYFYTTLTQPYLHH